MNMSAYRERETTTCAYLPGSPNFRAFVNRLNTLSVHELEEEHDAIFRSEYMTKTEWDIKLREINKEIARRSIQTPDSVKDKTNRAIQKAMAEDYAV